MTRGAMLTMVKTRLGINSSGAGLVPADATINTELNAAAAWINVEVMARFRRPLVTGSQTITWASGDQAKSLSSDFLGVVAFRRTDITSFLPLQEIGEEDAPRYIGSGNTDSMTGNIVFYFTDYLNISLPETATETIATLLRYLKAVADIDTTSGGDSTTYGLPQYTHFAVVWKAVAELAYANADMVEYANGKLERELDLIGRTLEAVRHGGHEGSIQRGSW